MLSIESFSQSFFNPMVHDPVMAYEGGCYYMFSTGENIQLMTSSDLNTWTIHQNGALSVIPSWTHDSVPEFSNHIWAPDVIRWRGMWWMTYSCSTFGKNTSVIGLARTSSLSAFHWDDMGCLVKSNTNDNYNAIDPNIVIDDNDCPWLVYGSFWDGIQLVRLKEVKQKLNSGSEGISWLDADDCRLVVDSIFSRQTIARRYGRETPKNAVNPTSKHAGVNAIEAPFIFKHDGWYYLFVSWDYCCRGEQSTYRVVVGRSKSVSGPYIDKTGMDMSDGGGSPVIEGDKKEYEAAGHCAAYHIKNDDIFICHGYSIPQHGTPKLIKKRIIWDNNGWFRLENW